MNKMILAFTRRNDMNESERVEKREAEGERNKKQRSSTG